MDIGLILLIVLGGALVVGLLGAWIYRKFDNMSSENAYEMDEDTEVVEESPYPTTGLRPQPPTSLVRPRRPYANAGQSGTTYSSQDQDDGMVNTLMTAVIIDDLLNSNAQAQVQYNDSTYVAPNDPTYTAPADPTPAPACDPTPADPTPACTPDSTPSYSEPSYSSSSSSDYSSSSSSDYSSSSSSDYSSSSSSYDSGSSYSDSGSSFSSSDSGSSW